MIWIAVVLILLWSLPWRTHDKALQRVLAADAACAYDILQLPRQVRNVSALDAHAELLRTDPEGSVAINYSFLLSVLLIIFIIALLRPQLARPSASRHTRRSSHTRGEVG